MAYSPQARGTRRPAPRPVLAPSRPPWLAGSLFLLAGVALGAILFSGGKAPESESTAPAPTPAPTTVPRQIYETPSRQETRPARTSPGDAGGISPATGRTFTGHGPGVTSAFHLEEGAHHIEVLHGGTGAFAIGLVSETRRTTEWLVNGKGTIRSSRIVRVSPAGLYRLNVSADGEWTAAIDEPTFLPDRAPIRPDTQGPVPTATPSQFEVEQRRWQERLEEAESDHDWYERRNGPDSSEAARDARRRANEAAKELGQSLPFPDED